MRVIAGSNIFKSFEPSLYLYFFCFFQPPRDRENTSQIHDRPGSAFYDEVGEVSGNAKHRRFLVVLHFADGSGPARHRRSGARIRARSHQNRDSVSIHLTGRHRLEIGHARKSGLSRLQADFIRLNTSTKAPRRTSPVRLSDAGPRSR